jgi:hypothetical protein
MKRIASVLIGALFVGASFGIAMAQEGTTTNPPAAPAPSMAAPAAAASMAPSAATGDHADEIAAFHRILKMHHRMWKRLKQNPNLVSDDTFVAKYPDLRDFLSKYDGAKDRILADPGKYLKYSEAKAKEREQTRGIGNE